MSTTKKTKVQTRTIQVIIQARGRGLLAEKSNFRTIEIPNDKALKIYHALTDAVYRILNGKPEPPSQREMAYATIIDNLVPPESTLR